VGVGGYKDGVINCVLCQKGRGHAGPVGTKREYKIVYCVMNEGVGREPVSTKAGY